MRIRTTDSRSATFEKVFSITVVDDVSPDPPVILTPADGTSTNELPLTMTGTAEPNSTVRVQVNESLIGGEAEADGSGNWTFTALSVWEDYTYSITATATDAADNTSAPSAAVSVTVDTTAPTISAAAVENNAPDTIVVTMSEDVKSVSVVGWWVNVDGQAATVTAVDGNGAQVTLTLSEQLKRSDEVTLSYESGDGTVTDAVGNNLQDVNNYPVNTGQLNQAPTDIALSNNEVNQSAGANTVVGTLTTIDDDAGDTHTYSLVSGTGAEDNGSFNISGDELRANNASQMSAGNYNVRIRTTDSGSATFEKAFTITVVDDVAPDAPVITSPTDGAFVNAGPTIGGNAEANSTVEVFVDGESHDTVTANDSGNWTYTPAEDWLEGTHSIMATATDAAGNPSAFSAPISVTIDTTAPTIIAAAVEDRALDTIVVTMSEAVQGVSEDGWSVNVGDRAATITGVSGNGAQVTLTLSEELKRSDEVTLSYASDTGSVIDAAGNNLENVNSYPVNTGQLKQAPTDIILSNNEVNQSAGANAIIGTLTTTDEDEADTHTYSLVSGAGGEDNESFNISGVELRANDASQLSAGNYTVRIQTTDSGIATYEKAFTITVVDDVAPDAPVIAAPSDGAFVNATPTISGSAEADSTVTVLVNGSSAGTAPADNSGNWTYTPTVAWPEGTHSITATATDAAGNTSAASTAISVTIDTTAPIISLNGDASVRIVVGTTYTDAGASASDAVQGDVTGDIVVHNPVDSNVVGTYIVTYNVSDHAGNAADEVQRTVTVIPPAVTVTGSTGGARRITVSDAIPGSLLTLYDRQHAQVGNQGTTDDEGTFVFSSVPIGRGYYVTQMVNGIASNPSIEASVLAPGNGGGGGGPSAPVTGAPSRQVPVAVDGSSPAEQVDIVRKANSYGRSEDAVVLNEATTKSVVAKALEQGRTTASILIDDLPDDPADEVTVSVERSSVQQLSSNGIALEIRTSYAVIQLSQETLRALERQGNDLYFRVVPIRDAKEKQQTAERTVKSEQVLAIAGDREVEVIGTLMEIETNYRDYKTKVVFPLPDTKLPNQPAKLQQWLDSLAVYIEHSNGEKKVQRGRIVLDENGRPAGIEIEVSKFSTFVVLNFGDTIRHVPYVRGNTDGTFAPDRTVTRAELAAMLSRLLADRLPAEATPTAYADVPESHWAAGYISAVNQHGLMRGYPGGTFRPDQAVTRSEYAHVAARLLADKQGDRPYKATDIDGNWAHDSIIRVLASGVMSGSGNGQFRPNDGLTRAEAVSTLNRLFGRSPLRQADNRYSDISPNHWAYGDIMEASHEHPVLMHIDE
ncbi:Ig-like domain-containing protein [Paenibacillaceae bacterium WGS1546]|uniref:Ig-like domain-containing protein n=1 Tax=Cohnella sp. WGS1546 TaxID=3366810 RepID=UPI00372D4410